MYIEIHNYGKMEQEVLYFKLSNAFNMDRMVKMNEKIAGIYAIYQGSICVYVGQSINLASRIANHLRGKYNVATSIYCWEANEIYDNNFNHESKDRRQEMLNNAEKYAMAKLKPIENLMIDMDFKLPDNEDIYLCPISDAGITIRIAIGGKLIIEDKDNTSAVKSIELNTRNIEHLGKLSYEACDDILSGYDDERIIDFGEATKGGESW